YVHFGGSPQALQTLRLHGHGQLVWNADGFRWSPTYMWRNLDRPAPHNVYTDGAHLLALARRIGVPDGPIDPAWRFVPAIDTAPLLLFDGRGNPVVLAPGQTFVEILALTYGYTIHDGALPPPPHRDLEARLAPS